MAVKSVICSKCGAEQAIKRNEDGTMNCMFCGEPIENLPEYDENEELVYPEDKVTAQEPLGEAIKTDFILSSEEVEEALLSSGRLKKRKVIPIIETVILSIIFFMMCVVIICQIFDLGLWGFDKGQLQPVEFLFVILVGLFIPAVWVLPQVSKKKYIKNSTSGLEVRVNFYENLAEVVTSDGKESWQLIYNGEYELTETENLILVLLKNHQILVVPKRSFANDGEYEKAVEYLKISESPEEKNEN